MKSQTSEKNRSNGLVVTLHFKPADGGIQEYVHQMALHMHLAGENIVVLAPEMKDDAGFDSDCGYKVIRFSRNLRSKGRLLRIICRTAQDMDADYLLCTHWKSGLGLNTMVASIISGIPYFITAHASQRGEELRPEDIC